MSRVLVYGLALTGEAVVAALRAHGCDVVVSDDQPTPERRARAVALGAQWRDPVDPGVLLDGIDELCPAPGVPETHSLVATALASGIPVRSELDLAYEWEQRRPGGPRPILAVTGTDGKTTTTLMTTHLLTSAGVRAAAVGNTETPFVALVDDPGVDVFVVECSSFRLHWITSFRAEAAAWLNFAPDHLNWHRDLTSYEAAKARLWANVRPTDTAIGVGDDPVVAAHLAEASCRRVTVATSSSADYYRNGDELRGPGAMLAEVSRMSRSLPHDVTNALTAAALTIESGVLRPDEVAAGLETFEHPAHRIEWVTTRRGVRWFNDSKATSPHAAVPAIRSFESIVLIAGGKNKNLDLTPLASEPQRMRAVVATGDAQDEIATAFAAVCPVVLANSMRDAVVAAEGLAEPGDVVLLSPACTSFDWYRSYEERGADFKYWVRQLIGESEPG